MMLALRQERLRERLHAHDDVDDAEHALMRYM